MKKNKTVIEKTQNTKEILEIISSRLLNPQVKKYLTTRLDNINCSAMDVIAYIIDYKATELYDPYFITPDDLQKVISSHKNSKYFGVLVTRTSIYVSDPFVVDQAVSHIYDNALGIYSHFFTAGQINTKDPDGCITNWIIYLPKFTDEKKFDMENNICKNMKEVF